MYVPYSEEIIIIINDECCNTVEPCLQLLDERLDKRL